MVWTLRATRSNPNSDSYRSRWFLGISRVPRRLQGAFGVTTRNPGPVVSPNAGAGAGPGDGVGARRTRQPRAGPHLARHEWRPTPAGTGWSAGASMPDPRARRARYAGGPSGRAGRARHRAMRRWRRPRRQASSAGAGRAGPPWRGREEEARQSVRPCRPLCAGLPREAGPVRQAPVCVCVSTGFEYRSIRCKIKFN